MPGENVKRVPLECLICAGSCEAVVVFSCGHHVCYVCGLRIHSLEHGACPACRETGTSVVVTRSLPNSASGAEEQFSAEEIRAMEAASVFDDHLKCYFHGNPLARELPKMYQLLCPLPGCWSDGVQIPFNDMRFLCEHLKIDHSLSYCEVCLEHRPAFLCEQHVYTREALQEHMSGRCKKDSSSFMGHPPCRFCHKSRFYDEGQLLTHMQRVHFTCDLCNRGEFRFTYYQNRPKLLRHFEREHKLCDHPDCASLDPMIRVFASDLELAVHKQRAHGVRPRVALFTGSVDGSSNGELTGGGGHTSSPTSANGALSTSTVAASGTNANVMRIIFDHVTNRETLELMPTRGHRRDGKAAAAAEMFGLPKWYREMDARHAFSPLLHTKETHVQTVGDTSGAHSTPQPLQTAASLVGTDRSRAFGVTESAASYNAKNRVPTDVQGALDAALRTHLPQPHQLEAFRAKTADFMAGAMLATRYYNFLRGEFFPTESAFGAVFPLLVATVPLPERREALVQVEKMRNAPETQRALRQQEEEAQRRLENEKWRTQHEYACRLAEKTGGRGNMNNRRGNANNAGRNVWVERGGVDVIAGTQPRQQHSAWGNSLAGTNNNRNNTGNDNANTNSNRNNNNNDSNNNNNNNNDANRRSNTGSNNSGNYGSVQSFSPPVSLSLGYHEDPEDFPALPSTNPRRALGQQRPRTQRPNAWQQRR